MEKYVWVTTMLLHVLVLSTEKWGVEKVEDRNSYIGLNYHIIEKDGEIRNAYFVPSGDYSKTSVNLVRFLVNVALVLSLLTLVMDVEYTYVLLIVSGIMNILASIIWYSNLRMVKVDKMTFKFEVGTTFVLNVIVGLMSIGVGMLLKK